MSYFPASDACDLPNSENAPQLPYDEGYLAQIDAQFQSGSDTMCGLITMLGGTCDLGTGTGVATTGTVDLDYPGVPVVPNTEDVSSSIPSWGNPGSWSWPASPARPPRRRPYNNRTGFDYSAGAPFLGGPGSFNGPSGWGRRRRSPGSGNGLTPGDTGGSGGGPSTSGDGSSSGPGGNGGNGWSWGQDPGSSGGFPTNLHPGGGNWGPGGGGNWGPGGGGTNPNGTLPWWLGGPGGPGGPGSTSNPARPGTPGGNWPGGGTGPGSSWPSWDGFHWPGWNTGGNYQSAPPDGCPTIVPLTYVIPIPDLAPVVTAPTTSAPITTTPVIPTVPTAPAAPLNTACRTGNWCMDIMNGCVLASQVSPAQLAACSQAGYAGNRNMFPAIAAAGGADGGQYFGTPDPNPPQFAGLGQLPASAQDATAAVFTNGLEYAISGLVAALAVGLIYGGKKLR